MKRIIILLLAAAMLLLLSGCGEQTDNQKSEIRNSETTEETAAPEAETTTDTTPENGEEAEAAAEPAAGETAEAQTQEQPFLVQITDDDPSTAYILVRMQDPIGLLPLPMEGEYTRTIRQTMDDGTEAINIVHLVPDGFWMEDANCEGHDCVNEGKVTLENREERVLWNMGICLPHQLSLELLTREEAIRMIGR